MKKISQFTNCYSLSKTLRFSLIPQGKTLENMQNRGLIEEDRHRAESYQVVKKIIDDYHKIFIEKVLCRIELDVTEYATLYYAARRSDKENEQMEKLEGQYRKVLSDSFKNDPEYKLLFGKELIREILPKFVDDAEKKEMVKEFHDFKTYFEGFNENRENMYTEKAQTTGIANRAINDNLPKYLDNAKVIEKIFETLPEGTIRQLSSDMADVCGRDIKPVFAVENYSDKLSQTGIDMYNTVIGGYTVEDKKIQGLNEYINLYNQMVEKKDRLPKLKILYKQILSDKESISFIPEKFSNDQEVVSALNAFFNDKDTGINCILGKIKSLFNELESENNSCIYISSGPAVTDISNGAFGSWSVISDAWNRKYDEVHGYKDNEKYVEKRRAEYKKIKSFSLDELNTLGNEYVENKISLAKYLGDKGLEYVTDVESSYEEASSLIESEYKDKKRLSKNEAAIELIKNALDAVKSLERFMKYFIGSGKESDRNEFFYGSFFSLLDEILTVDRLYDKVRNYISQKPYSTEKFKLNFQNPQFMNGWDRNKEKDYRTTLIRKNGNYYLVVADKSNSTAMENLPISDDINSYEKIDYKLLPDPSKMLPHVAFSKKGIESFEPSEEVMRVYKSGTFKKGQSFNLNDLSIIIDYYKQTISNYESWQEFDFKFKKTSDYKDIGAFFADVKSQGYKLSFRKVDSIYIDDMVESGMIYLFRIYNKDFSEYSKGISNLHTLFFKMIFEEINLKDVVFQMNGGAEMFYRSASITNEEKITHPANKSIENKNPLNPKKNSVFAYDLIKDKRYCEDKFFLHLPITLNFNSKNMSYINEEVRNSIRLSDENYVIGIDRGERNLIYICVVDSTGNIVEQTSLNEIINEYNGVEHRIDYHGLLDNKEKERTAARRSWKTIENIKELKEGYISQVVTKICNLVLKYDAVIAVEDLNSGFKNSRSKIEKQVYQKFENALISKMNFLASKTADPETEGGLLHAYQLTNKDGGKYKSLQNGFIFYVPAWLTSKIDPVTGFANLAKIKYENLSQAKETISRFDRIYYDNDERMFAFDIDYNKFNGGSVSFRKKWTFYSNGTRIRTFRNKNKNSEWDNEEIVLTERLERLFVDNNIDISKDNLIPDIIASGNKEFYKRLFELIKLTLQMRNSITGNVDVDYLISPVKAPDGTFYDSRNYAYDNAILPSNADANGAYNIARKGLWAINQIKNANNDDKINLSIANKDWLEMVQKND